MIKQRMDVLVNTLNHYRAMYYNGQPEIDDGPYDAMLEQLRELEKEYPQFMRPDSPTVQVGAPVLDGVETIEHYKPLLSLGNMYTVEEVQDWFRKIGTELVVENKLDGLALSLTYKDRKLIKAATRGDGSVGENVLAVVSKLRSVPWVLPNTFPDVEFELHGEVLLTKSKLEELNTTNAKKGKRIYANCRNAAAGLLRTKVVDSSPLIFTPYGCCERFVEATKIKQYGELLDYFKLVFGAVGGLFTTPKTIDSLWQVESWVEAIAECRAKYDYDIDGLVFKVDDLEKRKELGFNSREPKWAYAYKFPADSATTTLKEVTWQVGRSGILTPVANVDPVVVCGVTISRCTLHNLDEIARLGLQLNDKVVIQRRGDVIPKIMSRVETDDSKPITIPTHCPECLEPLTKDTTANATVYKCLSFDCTAKLAGALSYLVSRPNFNIDGIGDKLAEELIETRLVKVSSDVFFLPDYPFEFLNDTLSIGLKNIRKVIDNIRAVNSLPFYKVLGSIGIPGVSLSTAKLICSVVKDLPTLISYIENNVTGLTNELLSIDGIGEATVNSFVGWFTAGSDGWGSLNDLKRYGEAGVTILAAEQEPSANLGDVVITGTWDEMPREDLIAGLLKMGYNVKSKVTKNTKFLILGAGGENTTKHKDAVRLGIQVMPSDMLSVFPFY